MEYFVWNIENLEREQVFVADGVSRITSPAFKAQNSSVEWKFKFEKYSDYINPECIDTDLSFFALSTSVFKKVKFSYSITVAGNHVIEDCKELCGEQREKLRPGEICPGVVQVYRIFFKDDEETYRKFTGKIRVHLEIYTEGPSPTLSVIEEPHPTLSVGPVPMGVALYDSMDHSDVTLVTEGAEFRAHKAVLSARSGTFKSMFQHDCIENATNKVDLKHHESDLVQEMLRYMYTNKVENLKNLAVDLLPIADMYELEHLKEMCVAAVHSNIAVESVVAVYRLAALHSVESIKTRAADFIKKNYQAVAQTADWLQLKKESPLLVADIF